MLRVDRVPLQQILEPGEYRVRWRVPDQAGQIVALDGDLTIAADRPPRGHAIGDLLAIWDDVDGARHATFPQVYEPGTVRGRLLNGMTVLLPDARVEAWIADRAKVSPNEMSLLDLLRAWQKLREDHHPLYQATNAISLGRSTARTLNYVPAAGIVLSERTLSKIRTGEQGCDAGERHLTTLGARPRRAGEDARSWLRDALEDVGVRKVRHPGNHRYAWALGSARQRRRQLIALEPTPYPKAARDLLAPL